MSLEAGMQSDLAQILDKTPGWILTTVGGVILVAALGMIFLGYALFTYGKDIRRLNEYETVARLARLASIMEGATNSYAKTHQVVEAFGRTLDATEQRIGTLTSKLNAIEKIIDEQRSQTPATLPQPSQNGRVLNDAEDVRSWEGIREGWYEVRDRLESVIESLDVDTRRKYSDATRYKYDDIIEYLQKDKVLNSKAALSAKNMDRMFLKARPRKSIIDAAEVQTFNNWKSEVIAEIGKYNRQKRAFAKQLQRAESLTEPGEAEV
jgi:hypothetical protein